MAASVPAAVVAGTETTTGNGPGGVNEREVSATSGAAAASTARPADLREVEVSNDAAAVDAGDAVMLASAVAAPDALALAVRASGAGPVSCGGDEEPVACTLSM